MLQAWRSSVSECMYLCLCCVRVVWCGVVWYCAHGRDCRVTVTRHERASPIKPTDDGQPVGDADGWW